MEFVKAFFYFLFLTLIFFSRNIIHGKSYAPFSLLNVWDENPPQKEYGILAQMDGLVIFYANDSLYNEMLKKGEVLKWNPYIFSGYPIYANGHSSFYNPFRILFNLFFSPVFARDLTIFFHMLLTGIFTFLFLRELGFSFFPSLFGGTVWEFATHNTALIEWLWGAMAPAYLVMLLYFFTKLLKTGKFYWFFLTSVAFALSLTCGNLQWSLYIFIIWFSFYLFYLYQFLREKDFKKAKMLTYIFSGAFLFGFFLISIEIIPTIEFLRYSSEQRFVITYDEYRWDFITSYSIFITSLLHPRLIGTPFDQINLRSSNITTYYLINGYLGILPLLFLIAGTVLSWKKREVKFYALLFLFTWLIAIRTPLGYILVKIPFLNRLFHDRILFISSFFGMLLSVEGFNELLNDEKKRAKILILILFPVSYLALVLSMFITLRDIIPLSWFSPLNTALNLPFLFLVSSCLLFSGRIRGMGKGYFVIFSFILTLLDLIPLGMISNNCDPPTPLKVLDKIKNDLGVKSPDRISGIRPNLSVLLKIPSPDGYDSVYPDWYFRAIYPRATRKEMRWQVEMDDVPSIRRLLGVKYQIPNGELQPLNNPLNTEGLKFSKNIDGLMVYEVENPLPRVYVPQRYAILNEDECIKFLHQEEFNPQEFLLLTEIPKEFPSQGMNGSARILSYEPHKVLIEAKMETDGFLVLTDTYYPGWKAYVDGEEVEIYKGYSFLRAVFLKKGLHEVLFVFSPSLYKIGKIITFISFLLLIPLFFIKSSSMISVEEKEEDIDFKIQKKFLFPLSFLTITIISLTIFWWSLFKGFKNSRWYFYRGILLSQINRVEEGIDYLKRALSFKMPMLHSYRYMGELLKKIGKKEEAVKAYENARRYYPFSFEVFIALTSLYKELGYEDKVKKMEMELKRYAKKWAEMMEKEGFALLFEGDIDLAFKAFLSAVILDPKRDRAYYGLSLVYYIKGDLKKAYEAIEKAIEISPSNDAYRKNREKLLKEMEKGFN